LATVGWNFSKDEFKIFMDWWREELLEGHRWFRLKLPSAAGLQYTIVRFLSHREVRNKGFKNWQIIGNLEILERRIRSEVTEQFITTTLYPILDQAFLIPTFEIPHGQMSPPVPAIETFQAHLSVVGGSLVDKLQFGYGDDAVTPQFGVLNGELRDVMNTTSTDEVIGPSFTVLNGNLNVLLISNEIPPEGLDPSFTILSGSLI
jgi:hypothetical protein